MTRREMHDVWDRYCRSEVYHLCGDGKNCAYTRCSDKKWKAWDYCQKLMDSKVGIKMRFIGVNTFVFTCGFVYYREDGEKMFVYITPSRDIECPVSELERR